MHTDIRHSMENEGTGNTSEIMDDSEEIDVRRITVVGLRCLLIDCDWNDWWMFCVIRIDWQCHQLIDLLWVTVLIDKWILTIQKFMKFTGLRYRSIITAVASGPERRAAPGGSKHRSIRLRGCRSTDRLRKSGTVAIKYGSWTLAFTCPLSDERKLDSVLIWERQTLIAGCDPLNVRGDVPRVEWGKVVYERATITTYDYYIVQSLSKLDQTTFSNYLHHAGRAKSGEGGD